MTFLAVNNAVELVAGTILILGLAFLAVRSKAIDVSGGVLGAIICFATFLSRWVGLAFGHRRLFRNLYSLYAV